MKAERSTTITNCSSASPAPPEAWGRSPPSGALGPALLGALEEPGHWASPCSQRRKCSCSDPGKAPGQGTEQPLSPAFVPSTGAVPHPLCHWSGCPQASGDIELSFFLQVLGYMEQWPRKVLWGLFLQFSFWLMLSGISREDPVSGCSTAWQVSVVLWNGGRVWELSNPGWMPCFFHIPLSLKHALLVKQRGTLFIYCWGLITHTHLSDYLNNHSPGLHLSCVLDSYSFLGQFWENYPSRFDLQGVLFCCILSAFWLKQRYRGRCHLRRLLDQLKFLPCFFVM